MIWQPIETAPKDGTPILVAIAGGEYHSRQVYYEAGKWVVAKTRNGTIIALDKEPTHWMPTPEPPEA
jgi:hypothetical protein